MRYNLPIVLFFACNLNASESDNVDDYRLIEDDSALTGDIEIYKDSKFITGPLISIVKKSDEIYSDFDAFLISINASKNKFTSADLEALISEFDSRKLKNEQSKNFIFLAEKFFESDASEAVFEMRKFYRTNFRMSFSGVYSTKITEQVNVRLKKISTLRSFIEINHASKVNAILNLLTINELSLLSASDTASGLYLFDKLSKKDSPNSKIYKTGFEILSKNNDGGPCLFKTLNGSQINVLSYYSSLGRLTEALLPRDAPPKNINVKQSPKLNIELLIKERKDFILESTWAAIQTTNKKPSEIKANLSKYLLKPGSYYDILITDYANIPEPKPEKKP